MIKLNQREQQAFNNIFGVHSSDYADGVRDCKEGRDRQSSNPEYLDGYAHQLKVKKQVKHSG